MTHLNARRLLPLALVGMDPGPDFYCDNQGCAVAIDTLRISGSTVTPAPRLEYQTPICLPWESTIWTANRKKGH